MAVISCTLVAVCLLVCGVTAEEADDALTQTTQQEVGATSQEDRAKRQGFVPQAFSRRQQFVSSIQQSPQGFAGPCRNRQGGCALRRNPVSLGSRFGSPRFTQVSLGSNSNEIASPSRPVLRGRPTFQRQSFQQQLTSRSPAQSTPLVLNNDPLGLFRGSQPADNNRPTTSSFSPRQSGSQNSLRQQQFDIPQRLSRQQTPFAGQRIQSRQQPAPQILLERPQSSTPIRSDRQTFLGPQGPTFARQPQFQTFQITPTSGQGQQPRPARQQQVLPSQPQAFQQQQQFQDTFVTGRPSTQSSFNRPLQIASQPQLTSTFQPLFLPQVSNVQQPSISLFQTPISSLGQIQTQGQLFPGGFRIIPDDTREDFDDDTREVIFSRPGRRRNPTFLAQPGSFNVFSDDTREIFDDDTREVIFSRPGRRRNPTFLAQPGSFNVFSDDTREIFDDDTREVIFSRPGLRRDPIFLAGRPQTGSFNVFSDDTLEVFDDSRELIIGSQVAANLAGAGAPGRRRSPIIVPAVQTGRFTFFSDDTREDLTTESVSLEVLLGQGGVPIGPSQRVLTSSGQPGRAAGLGLTFQDFSIETNSREFFG